MFDNAFDLCLKEGFEVDVSALYSTAGLRSSSGASGPRCHCYVSAQTLPWTSTIFVSVTVIASSSYCGLHMGLDTN